MNQSLTISPEVLAEIKAFNKNVEWLKNKDRMAKKQAWVSAVDVSKATGWNHEAMRRARERGLVKIKREGKKILYDLSSINDVFLKPTA